MATINVTTTVDENNGTGSLSLREAVIQANGSAGDDTIVLGANQTYTLTIEGSGEEASATGDLDILSGGGKLTILASTVSGSTGVATINGGGIDRVFEVKSGADLNLENLTVTGGSPRFRMGLNYHLSDGGGIINSGTLNLRNNVIITNNTANYGGGIHNVGTMNVSNSNISSNMADDGNGGGIHNVGMMNVSNSTISSNNSSSIILPKGGGGIYNVGMMNVSNSTISSNSVEGIGGGIHNVGTMNVSNSTISSNDGGGIHNGGDGGDNYDVKVGYLNLQNTTITGNLHGGLVSKGFSYQDSYYGNYNFIFYSTVLISNSIIAQNQQNQDIDIDTLTSVINQGYNLIGNATGVETLFNQTGDIIGTATNPLDAKLGPLQDNGGNTFTHALLAGSPTINAGNTDLTTDQRGSQRDTTPDIGAYEYLETTPPSGATTGPDILIGTAGADTIDGLAGNDTISGLGGNDRLIGSNGDDSINGGTGDDTMIGGAGNDTYVVNSGRDRVTESLNAGRDSIFSTVTYTLPTNVENLKLQGTTTINGNGNGSPNSITGNSAANKINGGNGNDTLIGNAGNDSLSGGVGIDNLNGGGGNDTLIGDAGNDTITGSTGADRFLYNTNNAFATSAIGVDTITDFTKSQSDKIVLDKTTFTRISSNAGNGFSVASEFASLTSNWDRSGADIVYDRGTGKLFYNQNGTAAGYGTGGHFITLSNKPALSASDFIIQA